MMQSSARREDREDAPFSRAEIESLSRGRGESEALLKHRLDHLYRIGETPFLDNRYTRLALDWRSLPVHAPLLVPAEASPEGTFPVGADFTGPCTQPLSHFAEQHFDVFEKTLRSCGSWDALVFAAWREGVALRWKDGEAPGDIPYLRFANAGGMALAPVCLDVGERAEASAFLEWDGSGERSMHVSALSGRVRQGGSLKLFLFHRGEDTYHRLSINLELERDASVELYAAWMGGRWRMVRQDMNMLEPGASWKETHLILGSGKEHFDLDTQVRHLSPQTYSDVQAKAVLNDKARAVITGNVIMEKGARQGTADLQTHVLMLSPKSRADTVPGLEILAPDVKAAHAASVSQVDEEQLLYLESRGLSPDEARHILVKGFLASLFDRAPFSFMDDMLEPVIEERV
jgi:Fe-S cluster assembly scaffold protein SufB